MNVGISKTSKNSSDFVFINGSTPILLNQDWTRYEFAIPADTKYFAIHCQSTDIFVTMVDELSLLVKRVFCTTADVYQAYDQAVAVDLANVTLSWKSPVKLYDRVS